MLWCEDGKTYSVEPEDINNYCCWGLIGSYDIYREGDRPAMFDSDGDRFWFIDNHYGREGDKPAVMYADGHQSWWHKGRLHRTTGPAVIMSDGAELYYLKGEEFKTEKEWRDAVERG